MSSHLHPCDQWDLGDIPRTLGFILSQQSLCGLRKCLPSSHREFSPRRGRDAHHFHRENLAHLSSRVSRWHDSLRAYTSLGCGLLIKTKTGLNKMVIYGGQGCQY